MTWRYQICSKTYPEPNIDTLYEIHEVYDDGGKLSWTTEPVPVMGDTPEEVIETLEIMLRDAKHFPVLSIDEPSPDKD